MAISGTTRGKLRALSHGAMEPMIDLVNIWAERSWGEHDGLELHEAVPAVLL